MIRSGKNEAKKENTPVECGHCYIRHNPPGLSFGLDRTVLLYTIQSKCKVWFGFYSACMIKYWLGLRQKHQGLSSGQSLSINSHIKTPHTHHRQTQQDAKIIYLGQKTHRVLNLHIKMQTLIKAIQSYPKLIRFLAATAAQEAHLNVGGLVCS